MFKILEETLYCICPMYPGWQLSYNTGYSQVVGGNWQEPTGELHVNHNQPGASQLIARNTGIFASDPELLVASLLYWEKWFAQLLFVARKPLQIGRIFSINELIILGHPVSGLLSLLAVDKPLNPVLYYFTGFLAMI